ncbi:unnamed protein product, partial [Choristocarpus tenellus]
MSPRIVELSGKSVRLSWRPPTSVRTNIGRTCPVLHDEWLTLQDDERESVYLESLDVEFVELQTCVCGCPACVRGVAQGQGGPCHRNNCVDSQANSAMGCWQTIYKGSKHCCKVQLAHPNALQYFRLVVGASIPPAGKRGYMRAQHRNMRSISSHLPGDIEIASEASSLSISDADGLCETCTSSNANLDLETAQPVKSRAIGIGSTSLPIRLFASTAVFVPSRPPRVTLHGIGTGIVLTWSPVTCLSGAEVLSYALEHFSRPLVNRASPPTQVILGEVEKAVVTVGTRCWYAPSSLQPCRVHSFRLRLLHEDGHSVAGQWVSHLSTPRPPCCVLDGANSLLLSLPCPANTSKHRNNSEAREMDAEVEGEYVREGDKSMLPVVWYRLEGLLDGQRWGLLYSGPRNVVRVENLRINSLFTFRVWVEVDMTELRRQALGKLETLNLPSCASLCDPSCGHERGDNKSLSISASDIKVVRSTSLSSLGIIHPALHKNGPYPRSASHSPVRDNRSISTNLDTKYWRKEGFTVKDAACTTEGGYYMEQLPPGHQDSPEPIPLVSLSGQAVLATTPSPPHFMVSVLGGRQKARTIWWSHHSSTPEQGVSTQCPSTANMFPTGNNKGDPEEEGELGGIIEGKECSMSRENMELAQALPTVYPQYTLEMYDPLTQSMQAVYTGRKPWTELSETVRGLKVQPSTAYQLQLSCAATPDQAMASALGYVLTAPPSLMLEPELNTEIKTNSELGTPGMTERSPGSGVVLRAFWGQGIDTSLLGSREPPPCFSYILEMAESIEIGPPGQGAGGGTWAGDRYCDVLAAAFSRSGEARTGTEEMPGVPAVAGGVVREDSLGGISWALGSSAFKGGGASEFRVVWKGDSAQAEASTPELPPGMRFAFRICIESNLGIAVSAVTVYQTAPVVPPAPKDLLATVTAHETGVGRTRLCVRLSWSPEDPTHGRNITSSYAVQVR